MNGRCIAGENGLVIRGKIPILACPSPQWHISSIHDYIALDSEEYYKRIASLLSILGIFEIFGYFLKVCNYSTLGDGTYGKNSFLNALRGRIKKWGVTRKCAIDFFSDICYHYISIFKK
jgi:hypothetical protein